VTGGAKKLIRGLKDVSALFESPQQPVVRKLSDIQILGVSSPDEDDDSLLLNTYFASRMASESKPCSLVSLLSRSAASCSWRGGMQKIEPFGRNIKRHTFFWDEFREVVEAGTGQPWVSCVSRSIFMDFQYQHLVHYPRLPEILDKWILFLKPSAESLTGGYKMIKAGLALNPHLECFVLFQTKVDPPADSTIFEKFAALASKYLKIHLGWLGWLNLSNRDRFFEAELNVDQLHFCPAQTRSSPEQLALAHWIARAEGTGEFSSSERKVFS